MPLTNAPLLPEEISPLEQRHRDALLDVILTWARVDTALGVFLSTLLGKELDEGADEFHLCGGSILLHKIHEAFKSAEGGQRYAGNIKSLKRKYEKHSKIRNTIAHSNCVGYWKIDPDYIVFSTFQKYDDGQLVIDRIPIQQMQRVIFFGVQIRDWAINIEQHTKALMASSHCDLDPR